MIGTGNHKRGSKLQKTTYLKDVSACYSLRDSMGRGLEMVQPASLIFISPSISFTAMRKGKGLLERILAVRSRYIRLVISPVDGELVDLSRL